MTAEDSMVVAMRLRDSAKSDLVRQHWQQVMDSIR